MNNYDEFEQNNGSWNDIYGYSDNNNYDDGCDRCGYIWMDCNCDGETRCGGCGHKLDYCECDVFNSRTSKIICHHCGLHLGECECIYENSMPSSEERRPPTPDQVPETKSENDKEIKTDDKIDSGQGNGQTQSEEGKPSGIRTSTGSRKCTHCGKDGHTVDRCFQLQVCKECGGKGHVASMCRNRSKSKKNKGSGDRRTKTNDLVGKSLQNDEDKVNAKIDVLKDEIHELVQDKKVEKNDEDRAREEEEKIKENLEFKARTDDRFGKKRTNVEHQRSLYTQDEIGSPDLTGGPHVEDLTGVEGFDPERPIPMMPGSMPTPSSVVDDYDEDPKSYTFTSPVEYPTSINLLQKLMKGLPIEAIITVIIFFLQLVLVCIILIPGLLVSIFNILTPIFGVLNAVFGWYMFVFLVCCANIQFLMASIGFLRFLKNAFFGATAMVKWKNTYTFLEYLNNDLVDLRTDNQQRSDLKHKDAVYARYRYRRVLIICYSDNYRDVGVVSRFLSLWLQWFLLQLQGMIPGWLIEIDRELVISLEAFDQIKDFANMDFTSSDLLASEKIRTALKRVGTIQINRHLKVDPLYSTTFVAWAYFKHQQQKTRILPFYRAPLEPT